MTSLNDVVNFKILDLHLYITVIALHGFAYIVFAQNLFSMHSSFMVQIFWAKPL